MSIEPFKYMIQPVAIERDDDTGRIIREVPGEVVAVYNASQAQDAVVEFEEEIKRMLKEGIATSERNR